MTLAFVQAQLVVRRLRGIGEVNGAPLDVEDTVGRTACDGREDTARSARERGTARLSIGALIIPVRKDSVVVDRPRQRANVRPLNVCGSELRVAVGGCIHAGIRLVV